MPQPNKELDFEEFTTQKLETIQLLLQEFLNSELATFFRLVCSNNNIQLNREAVRARLTGIESLFSRELIFGEALGWDNMSRAFDEMLDLVSSEIKKRDKPN